jgi:hypothetical protein
MYKKIKLALVISSVVLLSACGGGGGSAPAASALATDNNPLKKYQGTYYICDDDDHSKKILSITATGTNSMSMTYVENIYQNASCTGAIVGTYSMPLPVTATYQSQTTANFPAVTILPLSDIVDQLTISSPAMTAQLTGSGVAGSCVYYTSGNTCESNLVTPATTITGASYLRGDYFVTLSLSNGVLVADGILSKNSSFKFSELISTTPSVSSSSSIAGGSSSGNYSAFSSCVLNGGSYVACLSRY